MLQPSPIRWLNNLTPWAYRFFVQRDHDYFIPFGLSVCALHWASLAAALWYVRRAGGRPSDIGLHLGTRGLVVLALTIAAVGGLLIAARQAAPISEAPPGDWRFFYPFTLPERCLFVFMAFSAGYCEEIVYRGFAITALRHRGWKTWQAILLATLSFIFIHGIASLFMFPFLFVVGVAYGALFVWRKSLTIGIFLHALFDVMAVAAI